MDLNTLRDQLRDICASIARFENGEADDEVQTSLEMENVWPLLLELGKTGNTKLVASLAPLLSIYVIHNPETRNVTHKCCEAELSYCADASRSFDERLASANSLVSFLMALSDDMAVKVVEEVVRLADWFIKTKSAVIPIAIMEMMSSISLGDLEQTTRESITSKLKDLIDGPMKSAAVFVFAVFAHEIMDISDEDMSEYVVRIISSGVKQSTRETQIACCVLLSQVGVHWTDCCDEHAPSKDLLWELLEPLMAAEDFLVSKSAHRAFRALVSCGLLNTADMARKIIEELRPRYQKTHMPFFFKVIVAFLFQDEDISESSYEEDYLVDIEIAELVVDMLKKDIHNDDEFIVGLALASIGGLSYKYEPLFDDFVDDAMDAAVRLVEGGCIFVYERVARFCIAMHENFKEKTEAKVMSIIPNIILALGESELGDMKHQIYTAAAVAEVVATAQLTNQVPPLVSFILGTLDEDKEEMIFLLCSVIVPLKACFTHESANAIFKKLVTKVREGKNDEFVSSWCVVLRKLLKRYTIDQDAVASLVSSILTGDLATLQGQEPHKLMPPNEELFELLACHITKSPATGKAICEQMVDWLSFTTFPAIRAILIPVKRALVIGVTDEQLGSRIAPILKGLLKRFTNEDAEELAAVVEVLNELFQRHPRAVEPVSEVITLLHPFVADADPENGNDDDIECLIEAMPAVAQFVFTAYGSGDGTLEVDDEILSILVGMLPFPPGTPMTGILEGLCSVIDDIERFGFLVVPAVKVFASLLLMKKQKLDEYGLSDDLIKEMKLSLRRCSQSDFKVEVILKRWCGERRLNRLKAILQGS